MRIVIDAGHGGHDSGAVAPDGTQEKEVVLLYARDLCELLKADGHAVLMTRTADEFVGLTERAVKSDRWGADCLISIHANAASAEAANGAWVIYDDRSQPQNGLALARDVFDEMIKVPGIGDADPDREVFPDGTGWVGHRQLTVISETDAPSILVELGFLTNPEDLADLLKPQVRSAICDAIRNGAHIWGVGKGLDVPMEDPVIDLEGDEPTVEPFPIPERVEALFRRPAPQVVQTYAKEGESFWCLLVRGLEAARQDPNVSGKLGPFATFALGFVIKKLGEVFECQ